MWRRGSRPWSATLAPATVRSRYSSVRAVLRAAVADRGIATDPSVGVRLPAVPRRDSTWTLPTTEQVRALLEHAPEGFAPCIGLAAFAGLRSGEIAGVQVGDVDFLRGVLHARRQVQQGEKASAVEIRPPKHGSFRDVAIPPGLVSMLAEHVAQHRAGDDPTRFLLAMGGEGPMSPSSMAWHWRVTARGAGIAQFKPRGWAVSLHDLRHFYASGLIAAGCDVVTVQRALGHAKATTTLNTYSHMWPTAEDRTRGAAGAC